MEPSIKITSLILSTFVFCFVSCRKEETKKEDTLSVRVPPVNNPPVANAGADETIIHNNCFVFLFERLLKKTNYKSNGKPFRFLFFKSKT